MKNKIDIPENTNTIIIDESIDLDYLWDSIQKKKIISKMIFIHSKANIRSRIRFKIVLREQSDVDIEVIVRIPKEAELTDTYLNFEVLNLAKVSHIRIVPSLEIENKEVKGGHAATIKKIDQEQLYYLESRLLSESEASDFLVKSFIEN